MSDSILLFDDPAAPTDGTVAPRVSRRLRRPRGTSLAMVAVVGALTVGGFVGQRVVSTTAFDRLEAQDIASQAQQVKMGLESWRDLLEAYGATNSMWDGSFEDVRTADAATFAADFPPGTLQAGFNVDGILGVSLDGRLVTGGIPKGDVYVAPPPPLDDPALLRTLFDPAAQAGESRCGLVTTSAGPYVYCGFAAHKTDAGPDVAGGLVFLRSLDADGLAGLSRTTGMTLRIAAQAPRDGRTTTMPSRIGGLTVRTSDAGEGTLLSVSVPAGAGHVVLQSHRPRPIHALASWVGTVTGAVSAAVGALTIAVVLGFVGLEKRRQLRPLLSTVRRVVESGDRTLRISSTEGGDVGDLAGAIDGMLDTIALSSAELAYEQVTRQAGDRRASVRNQLARRHTERRAQGAIDETAHELAGELESIIAGTRAMEGSVDSIETQVRTTEEVTGHALAEADQGEQAAQAVVGSVQRVRGIADLIGRIADQTNLLALNATIEAARAGEAGRGFAVVAGEVKNLATTTRTSTSEITETLSGLEQDVAAMAAVLARMTDGVSAVGAQATALTDVAAGQRDGIRRLDEALAGAVARVEGLSTVAADGGAGDAAVVTVLVGDRARTAALLDLHEDGLECALDDGLGDVPIGTTVRVRLNGAGGAEVSGVVCRVGSADGSPQIGVDLLGADAEVLDRIRAHVDAVLQVPG